MSVALHLLAMLAYPMTAILIVRHFDERSSHTMRWHIIQGIWLIALLAHATPLFLTLIAGQSWGLNIVQTNSIIALLISGTLFFSCLYQPLKIMAVFVLPFAAVSILFNLLFPETASGMTHSGGIKSHIFFSLLAYSILLLSAALAIVLRLQDIRIHQGTSSWLSQKLPALEKTETFLFHLLVVGFVLLTLGLVSGWIYVDNLFTQHLTHKTVLSMMAWLVLGVLLIGHRLLGWRGGKFTQWHLGATGLLIVAYLGSKIVLELTYTST